MSLWLFCVLRVALVMLSGVRFSTQPFFGVECANFTSPAKDIGYCFHSMKLNANFLVTGLMDLKSQIPYVDAKKVTFCANMQASPFINLQGELKYARVQVVGGGYLTSMHFDMFLPIPQKCFGTRYVVSADTGTCFLVIFNPNDVSILVKATTNSEPISVIYYSAYLKRSQVAKNWLGDKYRVAIRKKDTVTLVSYTKNTTIDGLELSGRFPFGVVAGTWTKTKMSSTGFGQTNAVAELFPPTTYFSNEYVIAFPKQYKSLVKIISLMGIDSVAVDITFLNSNNKKMQNIIRRRQIFTFELTSPIHVKASGDIMLVHYMLNTDMRETFSMTYIPPVAKWSYLAFIYPMSSNAENRSGDDIAIVITRTTDYPDILSYNLATRKKNDLIFNNLRGSEFSETTLAINSKNIYYIQSNKKWGFQVIQYGGPSGNLGMYSFPITLGYCDLNTSFVDMEKGRTVQAAKNEPFTETSLFSLTLGLGFFIIVSVCLATVAIYKMWSCQQEKKTENADEDAKREDKEEGEQGEEDAKESEADNISETQDDTVSQTTSIIDTKEESEID